PIDQEMEVVSGALRLRNAGPGQLRRAVAVGQRLREDVGAAATVPTACHAARAAVVHQRAVLVQRPRVFARRRGLVHHSPRPADWVRAAVTCIFYRGLARHTGRIIVRKVAMAKSATSIPVYLEIGSKRTFAGSLEWPGWCRSGRDPDAALATLRDYAPRYAKVLQGTDLRFPEITDATELAVLEHLEGNATTDFGAPDMAPASDAEPLSERDIERLSAFLAACWRTFDEAVAAARGKELRKGPR